MRERGAIGVAVVFLALALVQCGDEQTVRLREAQLVADNGGGCDSDGGYCSGEDNRGDCRNTDQPCSDDDFSPRFDDSPVDHSFNPAVCLPGSTCHFQGDNAQPQ